MRPGLLHLSGLWRASLGTIGRGRFLCPCYKRNMQKLLNGKNFFRLFLTKLRLLIIAVSISVSIVTISAQETARYQPKQPQYDNLKYGVPGRADTIVEREGYALGYIEKHEQPSWVCYIVTKEELSTRVAKRTNNFRADPAIPTGSGRTRSAGSGLACCP